MTIMNTPLEKRNRLLGEKMVRNLERRHFEAYYCDTSAEAVDQVLKLIPEGSSVTWGGSATIRDMGLTKALHEGNYAVIDRDLVTTNEEKVACYRKAFSCDFYLSSVNAISEDGVIVNIDGNGNRVAAISWGPQRGLRLPMPVVRRVLSTRCVSISTHLATKTVCVITAIQKIVFVISFKSSAIHILPVVM